MNSKISLYDDEGKKKSQVTLLTEIALTQELFHNQDGDGHTILAINGHMEVWPLSSKVYKDWLLEQFFNLTGQGANRNSVSDALGTLECVAKFKREFKPVHLRTAKVKDKIYIDLCDSEWRVVEIDKHGWNILHKSPVLFIRKKSMSSFPDPIAGGNINNIWKFLNIEEKDRPLVLGYILTSFRPQGPYPVLVLVGEQGTAKSTAARIIRLLIDPSSSPLRSPPKDEEDFLVGCINNWCVVVDNLSGLQAWFSDALCRIATGGAFSARALYTDTDEVLIELQRPIILNGIDDIATRPDLAERSIILNLQPIQDEKRLAEDEFYKNFLEAQPKILGSIFDAISGALRDIQDVKLPQLPRMADAALWVTAAEKSLGLGQGAFIEAYRENLRNGVLAGIESSPVGRTVIEFMKSRKEWHGNATELLEKLSILVDDQTRNSRAWPKSANWFSNNLRRLGNSLRKIGYQVTLPDQATDRNISIFRQEAKDVQSDKIAANETLPQQHPETISQKRQKSPFAHYTNNQDWENLQL
jgi:hypothetical protein